MSPEDFDQFVKRLNEGFDNELNAMDALPYSSAFKAVYDAKYPICGDGDPNLYGLSAEQYAAAYEDFLLEEDVEPTPELVALFARRQQINR